MTAGCKHPDKIGFGTLRGAAFAVAEQYEAGRLQRPYECACGDFHLTTKGLYGGDVTREQVEALLDSFGIDYGRAA